MANARRAAGELREADEIFAYARMIAERERVTDPGSLAELDDLRAISAEKTPDLYLCARHNLSWYLAAADEFEEALAVYRADAPRFRRHGEPLNRLRRRWLQARIAVGLGRHRQAERAFHEVQATFLERGMGFYAALVAMDLAELYLHAGRTAKVRELAEQMVPIFAAQDVHREALAALRLFVEAARVDAAHLDLVADLRRYLRDAQADREHRFR